MTLTHAALLLGAFAVPIALLWAGHRLRRRSPRWRSIFWGAIWGHLAAIALALPASMIPPEEWASGDTWRGLLAVWSLLILPAAGAVLGWLSTRRSS